MLNHVDNERKTVIAKPDNINDVVQEHEETDAVSIWETSRRRFRLSRHTAAQACTQSKRRQLRRLSGRHR